MPNRIVREGIITSEPVNALNWAEEVFYRRLLSVVDDYGRYHGNLSLLRAACYPLQLNKVADSDIAKWLAATQKAGLVRVYSVDGKGYVEVIKFGQQVRAKNSKFPHPPDGCSAGATQTLSTGKADAHLVVDVDGVVFEDDKSNVGLTPNLRQQAREVLQFLNDKTGRHYEAVPATLDPILARLKGGSSVEDLRAVIAKKTREWGADEKMQKYLRPKTLFNATNFANYKGELEAA
jgi:uncharacterized phage protein (TIGR02220 family)